MSPGELTLIALSGNDDFMRRRAYSMMLRHQEAAGCTILHVDMQTNPRELSSSLTMGEFFDAQAVIVVHHPAKGDLKIYQAQVADPAPSALLLLNYEGKPLESSKYGKWIKTLGRANQQYLLPKSQYDLPKYAAEFCVKEARAAGLSLAMPLALALVKIAGTDLGILSYEILKASALASKRGLSVIDGGVLRDTKADMVEVEIFPVVEALIDRDVARLARSLVQIRMTHRDKPVMALSSLIAKQAGQWLAVSSLLEQGYGGDDIASMLGLNPWYFRNKVLPAAQSVGAPYARDLIRAVAQSKRSVLQGDMDPWSGMTCRLIQACEVT